MMMPRERKMRRHKRRGKRDRIELLIHPVTESALVLVQCFSCEGNNGDLGVAVTRFVHYQLCVLLCSSFGFS